MIRIFFGVMALAGVSLTASSHKALAQTCNTGTFDEAFAGEVVLPQNWDCDDRQAYWFTDQGSQIIPYVWFLHLEQAKNASKFSDPANMNRLRYLPQKSSMKMNPDGLPIGFTRGNAKGNGPYQMISERWLGITCAACHTGQVEFKGQKFLIDGAPTMGDFEKMMRELVKAMQATLDDDDKFTRFAKAVMDDDRAGSTGDKEELRAQLKRMTEIRHSWNQRNQGSAASGDYGHGRLDALGAIFNETSVTALDVPGNVKAADAPVSYPFVWDTPQHDKVQWNGSIKNARLGSLSRNVGEVIGVFGALELRDKRFLRLKPGHKTSVNVGALAKLEGLLWKLRSPLWNDTTLPPIKEGLAKDGRKVFEDFCISCHRDIVRTDENRMVKAEMVPVFDPANPDSVKTDATMAINFLTRTAQARDLTGEFTRYSFKLSDGEKFESEDQDKTRQIRILAYSVAGTIVGEFLDNPQDVIEALKAGRPKSKRAAVHSVGRQLLAKADKLKIRAIGKALREFGDNLSDYENTTEEAKCFPDGKLPCYKARPLNGIWATAPYLHNGSVRTLRQLLLPVEKRQKTFNVGSREYDPDVMGFKDAGGYLLDTTKPGNSNNGHTYHADELAKPGNEKMLNALLEYLKTL